MNINFLILALPISLALSACSGSGSGGGSDTGGGSNSGGGETNTAPSVSNLTIELISNGPWVGTQVSAVYNYQDAENDAEGSSNFRWLRDQEVIVEATNKNYTLHADDAGKAISVEVTPVASSGVAAGQPVTSASITADANEAPIAEAVALSLESNGPWVGTQLTASYNYQDVEEDAEGSSVLHWLRDGQTISGATTLNYTLQADDANKDIAFQITPVASEGRSHGLTVTSRSVAASINTAPTANNLVIEIVAGGGAKTGKQIVAQYLYQDSEGDVEGTSQLRWLREGVEVATTATYTLQAADEGKSLVFEITPKAATGILVGATITSQAIVSVDNFAPIAHEVTLAAPADKLKVGATVSFKYEYYDEDGDSSNTPAVRWLADGEEVATTLSYQPSDDDVGKALLVEVTPRAVTGTLLGSPVLTQSVIVHPLDLHFFTAKTDNNTYDLIVTDGSSGNTKILSNISSGTSNPLYVTRPVPLGNDIKHPKWLFQTKKSQLAISDGTSAGTFVLTEGIFSQLDKIANLTSFKNRVFFFATDNVDSNKPKLWVTDGSLDGTKVFSDTPESAGADYPTQLKVVNDKLFVVAYMGGEYGLELGVTDGVDSSDLTSTVSLVKDIFNGGISSNLEHITEFNNKIYFSARSSYELGSELWQSDGTAEGTSLVKNLEIGSQVSANPRNLTVVGDVLYFITSQDVRQGGQNLWALNKNSNESSEIIIDRTGSDRIEGLTSVADRLYFTSGYKLRYVIEGEQSSAAIEQASIGPVTTPKFLLPYKGELLFEAYNPSVDRELFKIGSDNIPVLVKDHITEIAVESEIKQLTLINEVVIYSARHELHDEELWSTNGTAAGTDIVKNIKTNGSSRINLDLPSEL